MKLIRDTIHGYIKIPDEYCHNLIDTDVFQRLRRIEQTSIRNLFPCAHHDRFVHSLGTYHLGSKAIDEIYRNSKEVIEEINKEPNLPEEFFKTLKNTFEIACLLHDSGHAPFSHTFEKYFDKANNLKELLLNLTDDKDLSHDISPSESKPHEKVSAYLVLDYFKEKILNINEKIDVNLIVRMIIGCRYKNNNTPLNQIKNCLINLLNDNIIDVDKLDYAARDMWASGYNISSVDMERLLSSFQICKKDEKYFLCIKQNAISEINSLVDSANFQSFWLFNHHMVIYEQHLLEEALKLLPKLMCPNDPNSVFKQMFDVKVFKSKQNICGHSIFQLTDDDIIYLLKQYQELNPYFKEWNSRNYKLKPLWKSYAEYFILISQDTRSNPPDRLKEKAISGVKKVLAEKGYPEDDFYIEIVEQKLKQVKKNELFIKINNKDDPIDYCDLGINKHDNVVEPYFYIYVKKECHVLKETIIKEIQKELS
jgi:HD superfamily phosphohydrolase